MLQAVLKATELELGLHRSKTAKGSLGHSRRADKDIHRDVATADTVPVAQGRGRARPCRTGFLHLLQLSLLGIDTDRHDVTTEMNQSRPNIVCSTTQTSLVRQLRRREG